MNITSPECDNNMKINQKKRRKLYSNKKKMESYIRHYLKSSGKIRRHQNLPSISMSKKSSNSPEFRKLVPENTNNTPISEFILNPMGNKPYWMILLTTKEVECQQRLKMS